MFQDKDSLYHGSDIIKAPTNQFVFLCWKTSPVKLTELCTVLYYDVQLYKYNMHSPCNIIYTLFIQIQ